MIDIIKRYSLAFVFLFLVIFLMVIGTFAVTQFGDKLLEDTGVEMKPRGEKLKL